jgi:hypothetical protein
VTVLNLKGELARTESGGYPEAIRVLEEALKQAQEGAIAAVGMFVVRPNRDIDITISKNDLGRHVMIAGCAYLQRDLLQDQ